MYIAFKWLVSLALIMWLFTCLIHTLSKENMNKHNTVIVSKPFDNHYKNETLKIQLLPVTTQVSTQGKHSYYYNRDQFLQQNTAGLNFLMFIAGALAVTAFQKKQDIVTFAHRKIPTINMITLKIFHHSKIAATEFRAAIIQYSHYIREKIKIALLKICNKIGNLKKTPIVKSNKVHIILLKKLKEMAEERKNLGQLLIAAIRENKNIRLQYELETMTKNRLMQHVEDTQKQVKENRSRYVSFQQLYLLTNQENVYLKARVVKLKQEKEKTEKELLGLINEVYMSKNTDLKTYCARFLVKTKDNLLNSDVGADINDFLEKSRKPSKISITPKIQVNDAKIPSCTSIQITEIVNEDDCVVPLASDAPKLRGLPGECVWTVKDKDGIIEKLYEYDYESDLDNGDTIRRIRQYSVYFDKDCLIDFARTERGANIGACTSLSNSNMLNHYLCNKKIVTGSEAFQNFLKNSTSIVQIKATAHLP